MKYFRSLCLLAAGLMNSQVMYAQEVTCPENKVTSPAISATGPYKIQGFGQQTATAIGLPSCPAAIEHLELLIAATKQGVVYDIKAMPDGTYTVHIEPM